MSSPWWWRDAVCAEIGSDLFFVEIGGVVEARRACAMCPVQVQCLADVLESQVEYGIFAGLARDERRVLSFRVAAGADPTAVARMALGRSA